MGSLSGVHTKLIGVFLANRNSRIQQQKALKHDAEQRDREREMALRRDIYLPVAEAVSKNQNILVRIADLDIPEEDFSAEFYRNSAAMAKIQVVGSNGTVQAVSAFSHAISAAFLELILSRIPLVMRQKRIESLADFINKSHKEIDHYIELMKQLHLEGDVDRRKWKVIDGHVKLVQQHQAKAITDLQQLETQQNEERFKLIKICMDKFSDTSRFIPPAVFAVREELELDLDKESYLKTYNDNIKKGKEVLDSFLSNAAQLIHKES